VVGYAVFSIKISSILCFHHLPIFFNRCLRSHRNLASATNLPTVGLREETKKWAVSNLDEWIMDYVTILWILRKLKITVKRERIWEMHTKLKLTVVSLTYIKLGHNGQVGIELWTSSRGRRRRKLNTPIYCYYRHHQDENLRACIPISRLLKERI